MDGEVTVIGKRRAFFTPKGLAAYLQVSERTVREWVRRGDLPSYKLAGARRLDPADVDSFLSARREERRVA